MLRDIRMKVNEDKIMKKTLLNGIILAVILSSVCFINTSTVSADSSIKPKFTYEQIVRKYPAMEFYYAKARKQIKNYWYPPVESFENAATIVLTIDKNGNLTGCNLAVPSPDEGFNNSLINAAKKVKYSPLPDEVKEDSIDLIMEFNMQRRTISTNNAN